ncbi:MAG: hypothetical protein OXT65_06295 [Alphaproteobacteria bacterium]|nr:hypothetical protein [Alphaproteobacteria bacterium]
MFRIVKKSFLAATVATVGMGLLISHTMAEAPPVETSLDTQLQIEAKAKFKAVGYIMVEHESMKFSKFAPASKRSFTRQAYVSVKGLPGETLVMTCGVIKQTQLRHPGANNTRDCSGGSTVIAHNIVSGRRVDSSIMLTPDMIPNAGGNHSAVSIEVSYI